MALFRLTDSAAYVGELAYEYYVTVSGADMYLLFLPMEQIETWKTIYLDCQLFHLIVHICRSNERTPMKHTSCELLVICLLFDEKKS